MKLNRKQEGTTLVEVLIAAIIVAIGLLGIASLQVKALQASTNAEHRANAVDIAAALADRIRANLDRRNKANLLNYVTTPIGSCPSEPATKCTMKPGDADATGVSQCTPSQMATYDLYQIRCAEGGLKKRLPGGELTITCDGNCDGTTEMHITISWEVRDDVLGETNQAGNASDALTLSLIPGVDPED